jgi:GPH family glycoside/pentoside/hexuronide:cation symporter
MTLTEAPATTSSKTRWQYGLAMLGLQIASQIFGVWLLFYYTDVKRLNPIWASTALTIYAFYNAINNPLIGYLQDRTKPPRRLPYIRYGALPLMIMFALLWLPPFDGNTQAVPLLVWFVVCIVIYDALSTAVGTAYYSLLPEMFQNYKERTDVAARMNIFLVIALLLGVALPPVLARSIGWGAMGIAFATISVIAIYVAYRGLFETGQDSSRLSFGSSLKSTFFNRSFLALTIAQTMRFVTTNAMSAGMAFYVKYSLKLNEDNTALILATAFIVTAIMLYPWRQLIASRFQPRTTAMLGYAVVALSVLSLWFVTSLQTALVAALFVGIGFAGIFLMDNILLSDVIDDDEIRTGERREGMYFGVNTLVITLSTAIVSAVFGVVSSIYGYDTSLSTQPESVSTGFRVFMTFLPFIGCALGFFVLMWYPLHGERLRELKSKSATLRKQQSN